LEHTNVVYVLQYVLVHPEGGCKLKATTCRSGFVFVDKYSLLVIYLYGPTNFTSVLEVAEKQ